MELPLLTDGNAVLLPSRCRILVDDRFGAFDRPETRIHNDRVDDAAETGLVYDSQNNGVASVVLPDCRILDDDNDDGLAVVWTQLTDLLPEFATVAFGSGAFFYGR